MLVRWRSWGEVRERCSGGCGYGGGGVCDMDWVLDGVDDAVENGGLGCMLRVVNDFGRDGVWRMAFPLRGSWERFYREVSGVVDWEFMVYGVIGFEDLFEVRIFSLKRLFQWLLKGVGYGGC